MILAILMFSWIGLTGAAVTWGLYITARYPNAWHHRLAPVAPALDYDAIYLEDANEPTEEWIGLI